jgi:S-adenosylmethionine uptake transporter
LRRGIGRGAVSVQPDHLGCLYGALLFAAPVNPYTIAGALIIILSGWLVLK